MLKLYQYLALINQLLLYFVAYKTTNCPTYMIDNTCEMVTATAKVIMELINKQGTAGSMTA